jgi:hypothetical protein
MVRGLWRGGHTLIAYVYTCFVLDSAFLEGMVNIWVEATLKKP